MSALGQYVHLSWKNYEANGILRSTKNWTRISKEKQEQLSGKEVDPDIFNNFINRLKEQKINALASIEGEELQKLTKWYNDRRKKVYDFLKNANPQVRQDFFRLIIKEVFAKRKNILEEEIDFYVKHMQLDDKTKNIKFDSEILNSGIIKIPKLRGKKRIFLDSFLRDGVGSSIPKEGRLVSLQKEINSLPDYYELKASFLLELQEIENIFKGIQNYFSGDTKTILPILNKYYTSIGSELAFTKIWLSKNGNILLDVDFANWLLSLIVGLRNRVVFTRFLPKVMSVFSEAMAPAVGTVLANEANKISNQEIQKVLEIIKGGMTGTVSGKLDSKVEKIHTETIKKYFPQSDGKNDFGFTMSIGRADGKVDGIIDFNGATINASVKNYNLTVDTYTKDIPAQLGLVNGTPLTSLLFGAEAMSINKIGTHFLNVFAEHEDSSEGKYYNKMRKNAILALKFLTLYNGLTGGGGIKDQSLAEVLVIDSKTEQGKTYFVSMRTLLDEAYNNIINNPSKLDEHFIFEASKAKTIENIKLTNKKIEDGKKQAVEAKKRIANLLVAAHSEKISLSANMAYIKKKIGYSV